MNDSRTQAIGATIERLRFLGSHPRQLRQLRQWREFRDTQPLKERIPWLCFPAITFLEKTIEAQMHIFEYGGGGSTLWFEDRKASVDTIEHDWNWFMSLRSAVGPTTTLHYKPPSPMGDLASQEVEGYFDDYISSIAQVAGGYEPDVVLVDGRCRVECVKAAKSRVKRGGLIVLDDSQRPRYRQAFEALDGWTSKRFTGLKPGDDNVSEVTVWMRP